MRTPAELEALHREYITGGAQVVEPPADRPWGLCEMVVRDLDGNAFRIGAPTS